jgi:hypothetical protein
MDRRIDGVDPILLGLAALHEPLDTSASYRNGREGAEGVSVISLGTSSHSSTFRD